MNVEAIFRYVDADEDGALFVHNPTLQMRARAERLSGRGIAGLDTAQALSRAFEPQADAGWPPPLASPVSFRRATQTYKAIRRAIQHSQESLRALARRYGVNPKTVTKWKKRSSVSDLPTGPKEPRSTVLSVEEEAVVVAFRKHTLLPLDDCLYALQPTIPHLTRSSLHRCLKRHGISRLPQVEGEASPKRKFKAYPIGYFHIDIAEVRTAQGKLYLLVAIDRTSKFAFVELHEKGTRKTAADFLRRLIAAVPYKVHTVLTDNGTHFTDPAGETWSPAEIKEMIASRRLFHAHAFEYACALNDVDHRLTKPKQPKKRPPAALSRARGYEDWLAILGRRAAVNKAPRGEVSDAGQSCARSDATAR